MLNGERGSGGGRLPARFLNKLVARDLIEPSVYAPRDATVFGQRW